MVPTIRYPTGPITPHGAYHILHDRIPQMSLRAYDDSIVFHLMGGLAIPNTLEPESVRVQGITGLIPPWRMIDQKGATQDGTTFVDALYDPIEVNLDVMCKGRNPTYLRQLVGYLLASLDAKQESELSFTTHQLGRWWAKLRWYHAPDDKVDGVSTCRQPVGLRLRADSGFWQSYPNVSSFAFAYEDFTDTFGVDYSSEQSLGPNWPLYYTGSGIGFLYANGDQAVWNDDPDRLFFTGTRRVVNGPYVGHSTATDTQIVDITVDNSPEWSLGAGAASDIWGRMGRTVGNIWDGNGIRARIGSGYIRISRFNNFAETVLHEHLELVAPLLGEKFTLKCGDGALGARHFALLRNDVAIMSVTEAGTGSLLGASYRGVGFGMQGGAAIISQATPAEVRKIEVDGATLDNFDTGYATTLGPNWPQYYEQIGDVYGDSYCHAAAGHAVWVDNSGTDTQEVVAGPYDDGVFSGTDTDNQVVNMVMGSFQEFGFPEGAANDLWARMSRDVNGKWNGNGIRMRIENNIVKLSRFNNFAQTVMASRIILIPPIPGEKFTLIAGFEGNTRQFKVLRNGAQLLDHVENGTGSLLGPDYRGVGFGVQAGASLLAQATPAQLRKVSAGDNSTVSQTGWLQRFNIGDQPFWDRYTVFGPGTFRFGNGPGSEDMVEFGPVEAGQILQIRTDPRKRGVIDMTTVPSTPQQLDLWQNVIDDFLTFAYGNNWPPLREQIESAYGIVLPQGNPYSLLHGRFSNPIPAKSPGNPAVPYYVKVEIDNGDASSMVIASGTPLRRSPIW